MKLKIKLFDTSLPMPQYQSEKAAALDLYVRKKVVIKPGKVSYVPLNVALELPPNHWALLAARSSLHKKGLILANGIGIGDEDYCGDDDEYLAALLNFSQQKAVIKKGERIVQLIVLPRQQMELESVKNLNNTDRGGFGSTGSDS